MKAPQRQSVLLVVLVAAAMMLRVLACWAFPTSLDDDPDAYGAIAITLSKTGTFGLLGPEGVAHPTAYRPPLYPWLLSFVVDGDHLNRTAVICLHAVLGGLTVVLTVFASRRLIGGSGLIAGSLVAIDPILLQQSTLVMTETLAAALGAAVIWWWSTRLESTRHVGIAFILGVLLALAFLCRPTFLVWAVLIGAACLVVKGSTRERLTRSCVLAGVLLVTVGIWTMRNERHFGRAIWATSHGGYTILLANNPMFYDYLRTRSPGEVWDPASFFMAWEHRYEGDVTTAEFWQRDWNGTVVLPHQATETRDDDLASQAAKATIRREPSMFVWSCVVRFARLWSPMPYMTSGRAGTLVFAVSVYYVLVYLLCVIGLARHGRQVFTARWWAFWLLVLTLSAVHTIYWSNLRMRSPAISGIAILAATAFISRSGKDSLGTDWSSSVLPAGDEKAEGGDDAED